MNIDFNAEEPLQLKHEPETPCRPDVYGEGIFVEAWQRLLRTTPEYGDANEDHGMFCHIFGELPVFAEQGDATAAASFICWLGTNVGRGYLDASEKLWKMLEGSHLQECACAMQWAVKNLRVVGVNGGRRTIDVMLKEPTVRQIEVIEHLAMWLGSTDGRKFVADALAECDETYRALNRVQAMQQRAANRALGLLKDKQP